MNEPPADITVIITREELLTDFKDFTELVDFEILELDHQHQLAKVRILNPRILEKRN